MAGAWTQYRAWTDLRLVLDVPVALQSGATISHAFTVDRKTSYYLEIECERTPETEGDLNDALIGGLKAEASIRTDGRRRYPSIQVFSKGIGLPLKISSSAAART